MTQLGYPELGVGDAYKATMLLRAMWKKVISDQIRKWPVEESDLIAAMIDSDFQECNPSDLHHDLPEAASIVDHVALTDLDRLVLE